MWSLHRLCCKVGIIAKEMQNGFISLSMTLGHMTSRRKMNRFCISFGKDCMTLTKISYLILGYYLDKWTCPCTWADGWLHLDKWLLCTWSSAPTNWPLDQVPSKILSSWQISFNSITMHAIGTSDQSIMSRKSRELIPRLFWAITLVLIKLGKWQSTFWKAQEVI